MINWRTYTTETKDTSGYSVVQSAYVGANGRISCFDSCENATKVYKLLANDGSHLTFTSDVIFHSSSSSSSSSPSTSAFSYYRVEITNAGTTGSYNGLVVNEIEGFVGATNVFHSSQGTQAGGTGRYNDGASNYFGDCSPACLIDGDTGASASSTYSAIGKMVGGYFNFNLTSPQPVETIKVWYTSGTWHSLVTVKASNNGTDWVTVSQETEIAAGTRPTIITLDYGIEQPSSSSSSSNSQTGGWYVTNQDQYGMVTNGLYTQQYGFAYYDGVQIVTGGDHPYWSNGWAFLMWSAVYSCWILLGNYQNQGYYTFFKDYNNNATSPQAGSYYFEYDPNTIVTLSFVDSNSSSSSSSSSPSSSSSYSSSSSSSSSSSQQTGGNAYQVTELVDDGWGQVNGIYTTTGTYGTINGSCTITAGGTHEIYTCTTKPNAHIIWDNYNNAWKIINQYCDSYCGYLGGTGLVPNEGTWGETNCWMTNCNVALIATSSSSSSSESSSSSSSSSSCGSLPANYQVSADDYGLVVGNTYVLHEDFKMFDGNYITTGGTHYYWKDPDRDQYLIWGYHINKWMVASFSGGVFYQFIHSTETNDGCQPIATYEYGSQHYIQIGNDINKMDLNIV